MRKLILALAGATALTAASAANAAVTIGTGSSISLSGSVIASPAGDIRNAHSLDFTSEVGVPSPGVAGILAGYGTGTGAFAGVSCVTGTCGTIQDIATLAIGALPITNFFVLTGG